MLDTQISSVRADLQSGRIEYMHGKTMWLCDEARIAHLRGRERERGRGGTSPYGKGRKTGIACQGNGL